jgi:hypothetical protein
MFNLNLTLIRQFNSDSLEKNDIRQEWGEEVTKMEL